MKRFAACLLAFAAMASFAEPRDVYGIQIGRPLAFKECAKTVIGGARAMYATVQSPCLKSWPEQPGAADFSARASLAFPIGAGPAHVTGDANIVVMDGSAEAVFVWTTGRSSQQEMLSDLIAKFGQPTEQSTDELSNGYGAKFARLKAIWDRSDELQVRFYGMLTRVDQGFLIVGSRRGLAEHERRLSEATGARQRM